jgi:hypothetical protein
MLQQALGSCIFMSELSALQNPSALRLLLVRTPSTGVTLPPSGRQQGCGPQLRADRGLSTRGGCGHGNRD